MLCELINQNGWHFQGSSADHHPLWPHVLRALKHMNCAKSSKINTIPVFSSFSSRFLCVLSPQPPSPSTASVFPLLITDTTLLDRCALLLKSLPVCTVSPPTNSEIKLLPPLIHESGLISAIVQLWMNFSNILEAVYLCVCVCVFPSYSCWLVSAAETQTKHSGGCFLLVYWCTEERVQSASSLLISDKEKNKGQ